MFYSQCECRISRWPWLTDVICMYIWIECCAVGSYNNKIFISNKVDNYWVEYPATLMQDFYCRNEVMAMNSTGKLNAPAGADQQHTRVPYKLSEEISSWLTTLLALLISNGDAHLTTESTLNRFSFYEPNCLATLMHLLPGHLESMSGDMKK